MHLLICSMTLGCKMHLGTRTKPGALVQSRDQSVGQQQWQCIRWYSVCSNGNGEPCVCVCMLEVQSVQFTFWTIALEVLQIPTRCLLCPVLSYTVQLNHSSELFSIGIFLTWFSLLLLLRRCCSTICWVHVCNGCWIFRRRFVARSRGETINSLDTIFERTQFDVDHFFFFFVFFFLFWLSSCYVRILSAAQCSSRFVWTFSRSIVRWMCCLLLFSIHYLLFCLFSSTSILHSSNQKGREIIVRKGDMR